MLRIPAKSYQTERLTGWIANESERLLWLLPCQTGSGVACQVQVIGTGSLSIEQAMPQAEDDS